MLENSEQLYRLSAIIYAQDGKYVDRDELILRIVQSILYVNKKSMTFDNICEHSVQENSTIITFEEVQAIYQRYREEIFTFDMIDGVLHIGLKHEIEVEIAKRDNLSIKSIIEKYVNRKYDNNRDEIFRILMKYINELTLTNINSFESIISGKARDPKVVIENRLFSEPEKNIINEFLNDSSEEKDKAISGLVCTCLDYCLLNSGDAIKSVTETHCLDNKVIFLDTNIIYRVLGLQGKTRQALMTTFMDKCKEVGQKFIITDLTETEFFESIEYNLSQIELLTFGRVISPHAINCLEEIDNKDLISSYFEWKTKHQELSMEYYSKSIEASYRSFISTYSIEIFPVKDSTKKDSDTLLKYGRGIAHEKNLDYFTNKHRIDFDTILIRTVEIERGSVRNFLDTKQFVVSSDQNFKRWDALRQQTIPVVIYPSQWLTLVIRFCGRTIDELKGITSFIGLRHNRNIVSPIQFSAIIAGISQVTEDIPKQNAILDIMIKTSFQDVCVEGLDGKKVEGNAIAYSKNYLENELADLQRKNEDSNRKIAELEKEIKKPQRQEPRIIIKTEQSVIEDAAITEAVNKRYFYYCLRHALALFASVVLFCYILLLLFCMLFTTSKFTEYLLTLSNIFTIDSGKIAAIFTVIMCLLGSGFYNISFLDKVKRSEAKENMKTSYIKFLERKAKSIKKPNQTDLPV